ncbi:glycosyl transferase [Synergistales bacterium]|nr:glycosyl transferase [Synergistales bacterium]
MSQFEKSKNTDHGKYRLIFLLRDAGEGGAERSSLRLANALARRGHEARVFFLKAEGPMLSGVDNKIEIVDLKGSFFNFFSSLRARRADFLLPVYTSMRALMAKRFMRSPEIAGMKVILSQRNMFTMDRGPIQTRLKFLRCSLLYPYASAVVCISRGVADEMKTLGLTEPRKIRVIYNPVLNDDLSAQIDAPPDHPWFAAGEPPVLLGVGRLGDQKDFASLIWAFALLAPKNPDLRLMILGEGKERGRLESLLREMKLTERASLPGYAPNPYPYMKHAALFVLTSRFEGFGNVVAEALACGCNVVSTDCKSGPAEILDGGKYGRLAKVGDEHDIARAIEEALADPIDANLLRERAAFFSEERAVNEYERLFDELRG